MTEFRGRRVRDADWVDWFGKRLPLEHIGNIPSAETEERYCTMLDEQKLAAWLKPNGLR